MTTAERTHIKRLKRKREIAARIACHGSVFNHKDAHKWEPKVSFPQVVLPRFTRTESPNKKSMWQRTKDFFSKRV